MSLTSRETKSRKSKTDTRKHEISEADNPEDYYDEYDAVYETENEDYDADRPAVRFDFDGSEWKPYRLSHESAERNEANGVVKHHELKKNTGEGEKKPKIKTKKQTHSFANLKKNSPAGSSSRVTGSSRRRKKSQF